MQGESNEKEKCSFLLIIAEPPPNLAKQSVQGESNEKEKRSFLLIIAESPPKLAKQSDARREQS